MQKIFKTGCDFTGILTVCGHSHNFSPKSSLYSSFLNPFNNSDSPRVHTILCSRRPAYRQGTFSQKWMVCYLWSTKGQCQTRYFLLHALWSIRVWPIRASTGYLEKNKGAPVSYFGDLKGTHKGFQYSISFWFEPSCLFCRYKTIKRCWKLANYIYWVLKTFEIRVSQYWKIGRKGGSKGNEYPKTPKNP